MRLDRFLCRSTDLQREQAVEFIRSGKVEVNSEVVTVERTQVHENNQITLDGKTLALRPSRYFMIHKPVDTVCSNTDEAYPSVFSVTNIPNSCDLHIAGRLDADTTGLVLATDNGRWTFNITSPKYECRKVYRVKLRDPIGEDSKEIFQRGILLQGEPAPTLPAKLEILEPHEVLLTLKQGKFHQVKRMFAAIGNKVRALHRQQIGEICLDIEEGQWRELREDKISQFLS